jgi:hypothetical protein
LPVDQGRTFLAEDHQGFFILPRGVPSHGFAKLEAHEAVRIPVVCGAPWSKGQSPFEQTSCTVSSRGFELCGETRTAATNSPIEMVKMDGGTSGLMRASLEKLLPS